MNAEIAAVRQMIAQGFRPAGEAFDVAKERAAMEAFAGTLPLLERTEVEPISFGGVKGERVTAPGVRSGRALLYLHGGGYVIGSPRTHRPLVAQLSQAAAATVYAMDYGLAPERPFPAGLEDAVTAYHALTDMGVPHSRIVIAGDSAGGGLTLATALKLRDAGAPVPAGLFCISPWADLTHAGESHRACAAKDPMVRRELLTEMSRLYLGKTPASHPLASPAHADFKGLPSILIHVGSEEVLLSDSLAVAHKAGLAGVDCTLHIAPEMIHVYHAFFPMLSAARTAIADAGRWMQARFDAA
jgi:monoterpene epsilon-lactone hydrolase